MTNRTMIATLCVLLLNAIRLMALDFTLIIEDLTQEKERFDENPRIKHDIHNSCLTPMFSCQDRCNTGVEKDVPFHEDPDAMYNACACDPECIVYGDCCWDFAAHCREEFVSGNILYDKMTGSSTLCVDGIVIIDGCPHATGLKPQHAFEAVDLRLPVVSVIQGNSTLFHYKNNSIFHCNQPHLGNNRLVSWQKNISTLELSDLQEFLRTGISDWITVADVPPKNIVIRRCFPSVRVLCLPTDNSSEYVDFLVHNSYEVCQYIDRSIKLQNLLDRNINLPTRDGDESNATSSNSSVLDYIDDTIYLRDKLCKLIPKILVLKSIISSFSVLFSSQDSGLQIVDTTVSAWSNVFCAHGNTDFKDEDNYTCHLRKACGKGLHLLDDLKCVDPTFLTVNVNANIRKVGLINSLIEEILLKMSPTQYIVKQTEQYVVEPGKKSTTWNFLKYPFDDSDSYPTPALVAILAENLIERGAQSAFSILDNTTVCIGVLEVLNCYDLITKGEILFSQGQPKSQTTLSENGDMETLTSSTLTTLSNLAYTKDIPYPVVAEQVNGTLSSGNSRVLSFFVYILFASVSGILLVI